MTLLALGGLRLDQGFFELGNLAVLQLGHPREIALATRRFQLELELLEVFFDPRSALQGSLLAFPDIFEIGIFLLELRERLFERRQALASGLVLLFLQRDLLDLQLDDAPLELVERLGLGIHLHADASGGLVDQIDGLIRQLPIGDVTMRERRRCDDRRVSDLDLVVILVALLQAAQNRDGVLNRGFIDQHFLETTLERGVFLDVFAVLIERGRADAMQLAACERRLQHIARIHRAVGLTGTDHGVQLVDEENDLTFLFGEIIEYALQTLFKITAEFRTGDQSAHIERQDALVAQTLRHFAVDDTQREPFDDGGLTDARLTDQHRVVLGATLQHLNRATDLVIATDHRIELAVNRALREIDRVFLECLPIFLGVGILHLLATAHIVDSLLECSLGKT